MAKNKTPQICDHKCHTVGLNPWVESCPICFCPNPAYDPSVQVPEIWEGA